jgi:signal transduction histidine kinase
MNTVQSSNIDSEMLKRQHAAAILQERTRLARELHDTLGQVLGYVRLQAYTTQQLLSRGEIAEANALLDRLIEVAESAQAEVRDQILGLSSPAPLDAQGIDMVNTLRTYIDSLAHRYPIQITFSTDPDLHAVEIDPEAEVQVIRIVQEAITNVNKHGSAQHIRVSLALAGDSLHGVIEDDGQGFSPKAIPEGKRPKFGLQIMRERAHEVGGDLKIISAEGKGTKVIFDIPCMANATPSSEVISSKDTKTFTGSKILSM